MVPSPRSEVLPVREPADGLFELRAEDVELALDRERRRGPHVMDAVAQREAGLDVELAGSDRALIEEVAGGSISITLIWR